MLVRSSADVFLMPAVYCIVNIFSKLDPQPFVFVVEFPRKIPAINTGLKVGQQYSGFISDK